MISHCPTHKLSLSLVAFHPRPSSTPRTSPTTHNPTSRSPNHKTLKSRTLATVALSNGNNTRNETWATRVVWIYDPNKTVISSKNPDEYGFVWSQFLNLKMLVAAIWVLLKNTYNFKECFFSNSWFKYTRLIDSVIFIKVFVRWLTNLAHIHALTFSVYRCIHKFYLYEKFLKG